MIYIFGKIKDFKSKSNYFRFLIIKKSKAKTKVLPLLITKSALIWNIQI